MAGIFEIEAGKLRHRVTIQRSTITRDAIGGEIQTWADVSKRWASIRPMSSNELVNARSINPRISHLLKIRYYDGLLFDDRILYKTRVFGIASILNIDERNKLQNILVFEVTN